MVDPPNITTLTLPEPNKVRTHRLSRVFDLKPNRSFQCSLDLSSRTHSPPCRGRYIGRSCRFSSAVLSFLWIVDASDDCLTSGPGNAIRSPNSRPPIIDRPYNIIAVIRTEIRYCGFGRSLRFSVSCSSFIANKDGSVRFERFESLKAGNRP